jgi:hypothetical protein
MRCGRHFNDVTILKMLHYAPLYVLGYGTVVLSGHLCIKRTKMNLFCDEFSLK